MTITVYWGFSDGTSPLEMGHSSMYWQSKPEPLVKNLPDWWKDSIIRKCPATNDPMKNTYVLRFYHPYEIDINGEVISAPHGNQKTYDNFIDPRHLPNVLQILNWYTFFADKPLMMEQMHPYWHSNDFTSKATVVRGEYDIGKWFRPLNTAAVINNQNCNIKFNHKDISSYVRFHTDEKIVLKEFRYNTKIADMVCHGTLTQGANFFGGPTQLKDLYERFKYRNSRKIILDMIRDNLVE